MLLLLLVLLFIPFANANYSKRRQMRRHSFKEFEKCLERLDDDVQVDQKLVDDMRQQGQLIVPEIEGALGDYFEDFEVVAVELPLHEPIDR